MAKKRAIISVYNKDGVVDFAKKLFNDFDFEIISTGGTSKILKENGVDVIDVSDLTGFEELLGGRVKTLHPAIHAGILLSRTNQDDLNDLKEKNINPVDIVVVDLYPFEEASKDRFMEVNELIEFIDIGGVTLLRAASKNYHFVTPVFSPEMYPEIISDLTQNNGSTSYDLRKKLSIKTFQYTSIYDLKISQELELRMEQKNQKLPDTLNFSLTKVQDLRYGENPHQHAALYTAGEDIGFELLNGKELSFNNIADLTAALNIVNEFIDVPASCIIKHGNPCGVAIGNNIYDAYFKALNCDPISAFGGIIGLNQVVNLDIAKHVKGIFFEVVVAPGFSEEALEILKTKKNLRLVKVSAPPLEYRSKQSLAIKNLPFGSLVQTFDNAELSKENFKVVTSHKPTEPQVENMLFAWKVAKHINSNAIVIAKDKKTIGLGIGQTSRIASMELALSQACGETKGAVIASDGFYPAVDNVQVAVQARVGAIIQPGGSIKDKDIVEEAEKYNISMIFTGIRHFKH